jgi:hypothetical protein
MMKATLLQEFRAMQLAIKGACSPKSVNFLTLNGVDCIELGDTMRINAIDLDRDVVSVEVMDTDIENFMCLSVFSNEVVEDIVSTMRAKAVEIAEVDVMIDFKGDLSNNCWRL